MRELEEDLSILTLHSNNHDRLMEETRFSSRRIVVHDDLSNIEIERIQEKMTIGLHSRLMIPGRSKKYQYLVMLTVFILSIIAITLTMIGIVDIMRKNEEEPKVTLSPSQAPSMEYEIVLNNALRESLGETTLAFEKGTDQWKARMWMIHNDPTKFSLIVTQEVSKRITQRYALMTIYFAFGGVTSKGIDWLDIDECESELISCDNNGILQALALGELKYDDALLLLPLIFQDGN